jgi:hypothetical protein
MSSVNLVRTRGHAILKSTLLVWTLGLLFAGLAIAGCSVGRADARVAYWIGETRVHVPIGTRIEDAQTFFASRGLELRCCTSGPDIEQAYSAVERNIGRFAWTEYSALIVVDVSPEGRVSRTRVLRIGAGL